LEPLPLPVSAHRFKQGAEVSAAPLDRLLRELAFELEITRVGLQEPVKGRDDPFRLRRCQDFDLDQVIEEVPDRSTRRVNGGITPGWVGEMGEIGSQEGVHDRLAQLVAAREALLDQEAIELATLGEDHAARVERVAFGLEVSGEAVEMRTEQAAAEIDQGSLFFEPVFEHKVMRVFFVETGGAKVNDLLFGVEVLESRLRLRSSCPRTIPPLEKNRCALKKHSGYVK
jgi:hypothetical protein